MVTLQNNITTAWQFFFVDCFCGSSWRLILSW